MGEVDRDEDLMMQCPQPARIGSTDDVLTCGRLFALGCRWRMAVDVMSCLDCDVAGWGELGRLSWLGSKVLAFSEII
jgi:hypothetical protein